MSEHNPHDVQWMTQAIALARQGQYSTKPNPNVGCVIVKNNAVIGRGFHPQAGQPHAEVFALREAGEAACDATAYVTLEPCAHFGRTPPCALALVKSGVAKVVIACLDPNPLVAGKGVQILKDAGIQVEWGICEAEAHQLNVGFLKSMATGQPYVRVKIASSLDGRTAMASGESKWITGPQARLDVQHYRAISGAVITGINTVLADDCQLNVRELPQGDVSQVVQPKRIILDRHGRLPLDAKILNQPESVMVVGPFRQELSDLGVVQLSDQDLPSLLKRLCQDYQIYDVLVEAGATLATAFIEQGLADEVISYVAPTLLGATARTMFNAPLDQMSQQFRFKLKDVTVLGDDLRLTLLPSQETI